MKCLFALLLLGCPPNQGSEAPADTETEQEPVRQPPPPIDLNSSDPPPHVEREKNANSEDRMEPLVEPPPAEETNTEEPHAEEPPQAE